MGFSSSSRGDCRALEPLTELVHAFVAAVLELPPARADSLAEIIAASGASRTLAAGSLAPG
jgi:hypothetical protein